MSGYEADILALLPMLNRSFRASDNIDETNVCQMLRDALNDRKREKIEELVQGRYGLSYEVFLKVGKTNLPEAEFRITMSEISNVRLGACCLIGGFVEGIPTILQSDENCAVSIREHFAAIGEGAHLATAMMLHRGHHEVDPLERALYDVYEAKKLAENVTSVGKGTAITVMYNDDRWNMVSIHNDIVAAIFERKYRQYGPQRRDLPIFSPEELQVVLPPSEEMGPASAAPESAVEQSS
jgi:hypothetical protein